MSRMPSDHQRLMELLADEQLGQLALEDREELERLRHELGVEDVNAIGELLVAIDDASDRSETLPEGLERRLSAAGRIVVGGRRAARPSEPRHVWWGPALVAAVLLAAVSVGFALFTTGQTRRAEAEWRRQREALQARVDSNEQLLADARLAAAKLREDLQASESLSAEQRITIAEAAERELALAQRLADSTGRIEELENRVAMYERPVPPEVLAENRRKLLEVPDTIRVAWQPFDLPGSPAELGDVRGDVVWNDERQEGYLRFVGLRPNDPNVEQYQVWVIDERGMEQKVSGGVFNATADGEVIVPIEPGIDVGRVALFAVTIEEPGGIWVPNLERRVVVAPREASG